MSEFNIYLLRHGELVQTGVLCGRTDLALSEHGKQQLINATNKLPKMSLCFSSPLIRCRAFAEEYCQKAELSLQVLPSLQEMDFGDWDGKSYQSLWEKNTNSAEGAPTLGSFWQDPWQCLPPNGETMEEFVKRIDNVWMDIIKQVQQIPSEENKTNNVLVLSHGGVIRYILAKVLELPIPGTKHMTHLDVPYGALIHIQIFVDNEGNVWPKLKL